MKYTGCLYVVGVSVAASLFCEAISWLIIYRTSTYKSLMASISRTSKRIETLRGTGGSSGSLTSPSGGGGGSSGGGSGNSKGRNRKVDRIQSNLQGATQQLSSIKFQSGVVVGLTLLLVFTFLNSLFDGNTVAKLPFSPPPFFQKMTHRNLPGADATDCSVVFLYMLCSLSLRPNIQKLLGFSPPRSATPSPEQTRQAAERFFGMQPEGRAR